MKKKAQITVGCPRVKMFSQLNRMKENEMERKKRKECVERKGKNALSSVRFLGFIVG